MNDKLLLIFTYLSKVLDFFSYIVDMANRVRNSALLAYVNKAGNFLPDFNLFASVLM